MNSNVIIADDDVDIRNILSIYFKNNDFNVYLASNGAQVLELLDEKIDLVLLDIMMPDLDGRKTLEIIREKFNVPVVFISALSSDVHRYEGLLLGADDYIIKPFNPMDVLTKAKALIRRYRVLGSKETANTLSNVDVHLYDLLINFSEHILLKNGTEINVTKTEFKLLRILYENRGVVLSSSRLNQLLFSDEKENSFSNNIPVHIKNLRSKINTKSDDNQIIKTIWGVGYKIEKE